MARNPNPYLVELFGTFALVLVGAGVVCAQHRAVLHDGWQPGLVGIALAPGLIFAALVGRTPVPTEGYLNPAITLMLYGFGRFRLGQALGLLAAQLLGAVLAGLVVRLSFSETVLVAARLGTPHLPPEAALDFWGLVQGLGVEAILTFVLTFTVLGTVVEPRTPRLAGFGAGLALTALILVGHGLTGAACNPARAFGPVVWEMTVPALRAGAWDDHAVYWIGPTLGALVAGAVYLNLILPRTPPTGARTAHGPADAG